MHKIWVSDKFSVLALYRQTKKTDLRNNQYPISFPLGILLSLQISVLFALSLPFFLFSFKIRQRNINYSQSASLSSHFPSPHLDSYVLTEFIMGCHP